MFKNAKYLTRGVHSEIPIIEQQKTLNFDLLKSIAEDIRGSFTFTILNEESSLYIVKGSSPMCLVHFETLGLYIYAFTDSIIKSSCKSFRILKSTQWTVDGLLTATFYCQSFEA